MAHKTIVSCGDGKTVYHILNSIDRHTPIDINGGLYIYEDVESDCVRATLATETGDNAPPVTIPFDKIDRLHIY